MEKVEEGRVEKEWVKGGRREGVKMKGVTEMNGYEQERKVYPQWKTKIPLQSRFQNGAMALNMIRHYIRDAQQSPCVTDLSSYFGLDEMNTMRVIKNEEAPVTKPSKKIAWLFRWRGPRAFYNTKVLFLRLFHSLSACPSFDVTLVSLLDAGYVTHRFPNPREIWIPKKEKISSHMKIDHVVIHFEDILRLLGRKSRDLISKIGSEAFRDVFVVKWWIGLPKTESDIFDSVWISDDDVFYNGNLCNFLTKYHASREWDLLTSPTTSAAEWSQKEVTTYPFDSNVFYHATNHVIGMSVSLLGMIRKAIGDDILLHSDAFAVTLCKANASLCRIKTMRETIGEQYTWSNHIEFEDYENLIQRDDNMWYHGFHTDHRKEVIEIFEEDIRFNGLHLMRLKEYFADVSHAEKEYLRGIAQGHQLEFRFVREKNISCVSCTNHTLQNCKLHSRAHTSTTHTHLDKHSHSTNAREHLSSIISRLHGEGVGSGHWG